MVNEEYVIKKISKKFGDEIAFVTFIGRWKQKANLKHVTCGHYFIVKWKKVLRGNAEAKTLCAHCKNQKIKDELKRKFNGGFKILRLPGNKRERVTMFHKKCLTAFEVKRRNIMKGYCPQCDD